MDDATKDRITELMTKPALAGATAYVATLFTWGKNPSSGEMVKMTINSNIPGISQLNGKRMSLALATGAFVFLGSLAGDAVSYRPFPYIAKQEMTSHLAPNAVLTASVCGTTLLTHYMANPASIGQRGLMNIFGMAVACEAVGNIAYDYLRPIIRGEENEEGYDYFFDDIPFL